MAYTAPQIATILLKADKTMYKIGQIAYENMFAEDNEALDYERDVIFIYKKAVEYADDFFVGTEKLDKVVERLATKISAYDYGVLNPIYADAATINTPVLLPGSTLNDLTDVTISNLLDNQLLRYNAATGQWINVGPGAAVRNSQAFIATAGQTVFTTSYPFDAGLFDLYVNGVKLNSLSYTTMGEYQITLNDPCIAGDIVDVVIYDSYTGINPSIGSLNDLTDVSIGALTNNQALYYNSATGLWQNGLVFVPYTGATASVDLGEFEIRAGQFTLDTSPTGTATVGTTRWNDSIGSSETTLKGGSVILKNGVDLVARVVNKVTPNTTLTKASYAAVRISGAQGQRLAVAYAQANNDANSADTIGLVTETIATNQEGFIMTMGQLENINTTGSLQGETWVDGDVLYLSPTTAGAITNVKPTGATGHLVIIGYVEYAHANNGKIYVKVMNGWELDELHNVSIVTPANNQGLFYNSSNSLWENKTISTALGYTPVPTTRNITINGVTYDLSADRTYTISTGISGSGASGQVTYWTGSSAVSGSNNLFWNAADSTFRIGYNTPQEVGGSIRGFQISGTSILNSTMSIVRNSNDTAAASITFGKTRATSNGGQVITQNGDIVGGIGFAYSDGVVMWACAGIQSFVDGTPSLNNTPGGIQFSTTSSGISPTVKARIFATGNFVLQNGGTFSDGGQRLQVIGDTLLRGSGNTSATTALTVQNSDGTALFRVRNDGQSISRGGIFYGSSTNNLITTSNDTNALDVTGLNFSILFGSFATSGYGVAISGYNASTRTATSGISGTLNLSHGFAPTSGNGTYRMLNLEGTINQQGGANGITRGLYINPTLTAAADWRSIEWSNNSGWGLYGAGTANNYLAGRLAIGATSAIANNIFQVALPMTSATVVSGVNSYGQIQSDVTSEARYFNSAASTQAATFTLNNLIHFNANQSTFGANSIVTTQIGFHVNSSLTGATNNYGFYGNIASGTGRWNLYMNGTANNYIAGNLGIGITPTVRLQVSGDTILRGSGNTSATTALTVQNSDGSLLMSFNNAGSFLFGPNAQRSYLSITDALGTLGTQTLTVQSNLTISNNRVASVSLPNGSLFVTRDGIETSTVGGTSLFVVGHKPSDSFAPTSGNATNTSIVLAPRINQVGATGITRGLYVNPTLTAAADWRSIEWSNNSGWGLYGAGTANNYLAGSLGIGTTSLTGRGLYVSQNATGSSGSAWIISAESSIQSDVTNSAVYFQTFSRTQAATFTLSNLRHFNAQQGTFGASSTITNQFGFNVSNSLIGATNNYGFYGDIASGTGRWNLYMNGTADNYLAGNLGIGITPTVRLHVSGDTILKGSGATSATTALTVQNSSSTNLFTVRNDGVTAFAGDMTLSKSTVAQFNITDTSNTTATESYFKANAGTTESYFGSYGQGRTPYKIIGGGDLYIYKSRTAGNLSIINDQETGSIIMAAGGSSTAHITIASTGKVLYAAATTAKAQINLASGTAPTSPVNGDIWFDGTDIKMRIGGVTKTFTLV